MDETMIEANATRRRTVGKVHWVIGYFNICAGQPVSMW